jgi:hypothetical protein
MSPEFLDTMPVIVAAPGMGALFTIAACFVGLGARLALQQQ